MKIIFLFSFLLTSTVLMANNKFNAETIKKWSANQSAISDNTAQPFNETIVDSNISKVINEAITFRTIATNGLELAIFKSSVESGVFDFITSSANFKKHPELWSYFFSTSIVLVGNGAGSNPVAAYYNPYLGFAMLVRFGLGDEKVILQEATIVSGDDLAFNQVAKKIPSGLSAPFVINNEYINFVKFFEAKYPFIGNEPVNFNEYDDKNIKKEQVEQLAFKALLNLQILYANEDEHSLKNSVKEIINAIKIGKVSELSTILPTDNAITPELILLMPQVIRADFRPSYVMFGADNKALIFFINMLSPKVYGVMEYKVEDIPELVSLTFFDIKVDYLSNGEIK